MQRKRLTVLLALTGFLLMIGCTAALPPKTEFSPVDLNSKVASGEYEAKVDQFYVVVDASSSMNEAYHGSVHNGYPKFDVEKDLVKRMYQTLPNLDIMGGMGAFGLHPKVSRKLAINLVGPATYNQTEFIDGLNPLSQAGGTTPLAVGMEEAREKLMEANVQGSVALVLFSDGMETSYSGKGLKAVESLKEAYGDQLCIYTVWVGNEPEGKARLDQLAEAGGCGFSTTADEIMSADGMANFVDQVFLAKAPPKPMPAAAPAPKITWILSDVNFDFNKWDLRPDAKQTLDRDIAILKENPQIKVEIQGHTDSVGPEEYNQVLSEKRAESVKNYLIEQGIASSRLTSKGYGETRPRFPNDTEENRFRNRRVEMVPFE